MSEPISQHIVPKCYLQNFAVEKRKEEFFVDVLFNKSKDKKIHRQNIKNICKIREFYTFDDLHKSDKRWLEKYYSRHIESLYHNIYTTLIDPTIENVSKDFKLKILVYIISQELRTPKLSDALNSITDRTIEYAFLAHEQLGSEKKIFSEKGEQLLDLEGKTKEEALKENNRSNRQLANVESVKRLKQIAELKLSYHILVAKYRDDLGLISSDRPVYTDTSLYSPDCNIKIPIDKNHMVCLYPNDKELDPDPLKILRLDFQGQTAALQVMAYNMLQVEKADSFLYGRENDIIKAVNQYAILKNNYERQ